MGQVSEALRLADLCNRHGHLTNIERSQIDAELRRLHAENEELRKDAERYRFLRDNSATYPAPQSPSVEELRELASEALSAAESCGHPLGGGIASRRAEEAKQELWDAIGRVAPVAQAEPMPPHIDAALNRALRRTVKFVDDTKTEATPAAAEPLWYDFTLDEVKARLQFLNVDDLRGLVVSLLITQRIERKAMAAPAQAQQAENAALRGALSRVLTAYQVAAEEADKAVDELAATKAEATPICWGVFKSTGELYSFASSREHAENYVAQMHQSSDSLTLHVAPVYTHAATEPAQAQQAGLRFDGLTPHEFALRELHAFQEATGCDTAEEFAATKTEAKPLTVPHPGSPEASAMIDSELAAHGWASNTKNAARAGYEACRKLMGAGIGASSGGKP
jgi:hypothetical protein